MLRNFFVVSMVAGLAVFGSGCGNACDDYADAAQAKADECGLTTSDGETSDTTEAECTDAAATLAECLTPCIENVSCDAFDPEAEGYADAVKSYSDCVTACS